MTTIEELAQQMLKTVRLVVREVLHYENDGEMGTASNGVWVLGEDNQIYRLTDAILGGYSKRYLVKPGDKFEIKVMNHIVEGKKVF